MYKKILIFVIAFVLMTVIHEGSHKLGGAVFGLESDIHWNYLYNANATYNNSINLTSEDTSPSGWFFFFITPYLVSIVMIGIIHFLLNMKLRDDVFILLCSILIIILFIL